MLAHMKSLFFLAAATGAGLVSVNALSLTSSCQDSLRGLLTNEDAACLNVLSIASSALQDGGSVINAVDSWLNGMCSTGACSDINIANLITNVTTGCNDDLANLGLSATEISSNVINIAQKVYPVVRQGMCLKDDSTNQMCITEMLTNLDSIIGGLSLDDLSFVNLMNDVRQLLASGVQKMACTSCVKAGFSIAQQAFPSIVSAAQPEAEALCGADFVDGSSPEGISDTANPDIFVAQPSGSTAADNGGFALTHSASYMKTGLVLGAISAFAFLL
ncbi:hypothetical protein K435DRAFT_963108 [Dendrothele bispora CBS 962.96]|uniref:Uncharacterized protein n=1 Tax=Dendrothele bispora (strain CBS 962.96) TaxID=1314807 RepID=A0A4S8MJK6_DENBC|nr:hypothetical protein K435DRAFT_963108 [Dendrothele bispora CBS 962.96]